MDDLIQIYRQDGGGFIGEAGDFQDALKMVLLN
jgi:hypothetical protein